LRLRSSEYTLSGMNGTPNTVSANIQKPQQTFDSGGPAPQTSREKVISATRKVFSFPALLTTLLVTTVFEMSRHGLSDPDIWFHLHNAEWLVSTHTVPRVEMYSYTAGGQPWINPEYLAEVPYYLAWRAFGLVGIKTLSMVLLETIFLALLYYCWKESGNIKASAIACYFAVFMGTVSFGPRTILFGYGYMMVLLILLQRFRLKENAPLWLLPPLFCLWINTHGSWSLGLVVFGLVIVGGLIGGKFGRIDAVPWSAAQLRKLLFTMGASILALFINPYGFQLISYPVDLAFRQKLAVEHVAEWVSVDFHTPRGKVVLILIVGLLLAALLSEYRWQLHDLILVLFGLYTGLTYIRFLFLAALLIAPLLAKFLRFVPPYQREIDKHILNALLMAGMIAFIIHGFPSSSDIRESIEKDYPAEILPYLKTHPPTGPVLNSYLWGGYLCWNDRDFREFIDSRADTFVYTGVFKDYIDLLGLKDYAAVLDKYKIKYVLFGPNEPITLLLKRDPNWKVAFNGKVSTMLERVGSSLPAQADMTGVPGT
jgi:hypothetical protein